MPYCRRYPRCLPVAGPLIFAVALYACAQPSHSSAEATRGTPQFASDASVQGTLPENGVRKVEAAILQQGGVLRAHNPWLQRDPNGNDDPARAEGRSGTGEPTMVQAASAAELKLTLTRVGSAPLALQRICDLTVLDDALYAAHARQPLGTDGATITRYQPASADGYADAGADPQSGHESAALLPGTFAADKPFRIAFDWNRPGEPVKGGGAGQGFLRVHNIDHRLWVPDADPPYNGLGLAEYGTEGYVFVSGSNGVFARARMPKYRPPSAPSHAVTAVTSADAGVLGADAGVGMSAAPGAAVLPRAYHVIDVIKFRGHMYASTGSVPPKERAWQGPSPGALHMADESLARWNYVLGYPVPYQNGVWRLTYMVRFHDRLYAGIQDYDGIEPHSYVQFAPPKERDTLTQEDVKPIRVPGYEGANTLRWFADGQGAAAKLYWLAYARRTGDVALLVTSDGDTWQRIVLPEAYGRPSDIVRYHGALVVLTERALIRLGDAADAADAGAGSGASGSGEERGGVTVLAEVPVDSKTKKGPFQVDDLFCVAPLAEYRGALYAGGQRDGALYRFAGVGD